MSPKYRQLNNEYGIPYASLEDEENFESPEKGSPLEIGEPQRSGYWRLAGPWICLSALLALLNLAQLSRPWTVSPYSPGVPSNPGQKSRERGYRTDFDDARRVIESEERDFTGWISYNSSTDDVYRVFDSNEPQYFGEPSDQLDAAWDELLKWQYVAMTDEEASHFDGIVRSATTGNFHMQPAVYHSLHCLNSIRMELEPEYYLAHPRPDADVPVPKSWPQVHRDHCLDQIRQSLQCAGDLSPAPFAAWDGFHLSIAEGRTHTCRKFEPIKSWVGERDRLSPAVPGD